MNFKDKTIVITGASSGIGYALAYEFASRGARIVMGARSEDKLRSIAEDLAARGTQAVYEPTDVTREEDCRRLVEKAVSSFGQIDVLICNAGISMRALFDEVDLGVLKRLMDVNFWGTVYCTKYALPYIQASRGSIVGVSSVAGFHGLPGRTGYSASKYAMTGFLETVRIENLKKGSGFHGVERTFLSPDRRRIGSGRVAAQGGEDDERRRSGPPHRARGRPAQAYARHGLQRARHRADQKVRAGIA